MPPQSEKDSTQRPPTGAGGGSDHVAGHPTIASLSGSGSRASNSNSNSNSSPSSSSSRSRPLKAPLLNPNTVDSTSSSSEGDDPKFAKEQSLSKAQRDEHWESQWGRFFTPWRILLLFTTLAFLTYFDRGTFSASQDAMVKSYGFSTFEYGVAAGAYLVGFSLCGPIFAHLANTYPPMRLMTYGLFMWALAVVFSGLAPEFFTLVLARCLTGIGEASFLCIAPPFIDEFAPKHARSQWLALFYCAIPIGVAAGIMGSGQWLEALVFGDHWTWRSVFIFQGILMIPLALTTFTIHGPPTMKDMIPDPARGSVSEGVDGAAAGPDERRSRKGTFDEMPESQWGRVVHELAILARNPPYIFIVLAYSAQTFVVGGFSVHGPRYVQEVLGYSIGNATFVFGAVTVATGLLGTAFGGFALDTVRKRAASEAHAVPYACLMLTIFSVVAAPPAILAFIHANDILFFILMFIAEFVLFAQIAPINSAIMWLNPIEFRPFALSVATICIHLLGDAISPSIIGLLVDNTDDWQLSMFIASCWLVVPVIFFLFAWRSSIRRVKRSALLDIHKQGLIDVIADNDDEENLLANDQLSINTNRSINNA